MKCDQILINQYDLKELLSNINHLIKDVELIYNDHITLKKEVERINKILNPSKTQKNNINPKPLNQYYLRMNKTTKPENRRYFYKGFYFFTAKPEYYNLLNNKFNELMKKHTDLGIIKIRLKEYLHELKNKEDV